MFLSKMHNCVLTGIENSFLHGLSLLIATMLEAKESESVLTMSEDWIVFEASNLDSISRTGTLRSV